MSGHRRTILNHNEFITSEDWNLAQAQVAAQRAQILRSLNGGARPDKRPAEYPGLNANLTTLPSTTRGTPHDVFGGLLVRPDGGSYLLVDPGVCGMCLTNFAGLGSNDDPYIIVTSSGVVDESLLTFTSNAGAGPRIDIVEVTAVDTLIAPALRKIMQPGGGSVEQVVEKVREGRLTFRIRLGMPDGGFPPIEQNWLPIAVIITPTTAVGFNNCDIYDTRPLVSERVNQSGSWTLPEIENYTNATITDRSIPGREGEVVGWVYGEAHGYKIGGQLYKNTPTGVSDFGGAGDAHQILTANAENHLPAAAAPSITDGSLNAILLCFPLGLPRWVRYSEAPVATGLEVGQVATVGRLPQGPNGIVLVGRPSDISAKGVCPIVGYPPLFGTGAGAGQFDEGVCVGWTIGNGTLQITVDSSGKQHRLLIAGEGYPQAFSLPALPSASVLCDSPVLAKVAPSDLNLGTTPNRIPNNARHVLARVRFTGECDIASLISATANVGNGTQAFASAGDANQRIPTYSFSGDNVLAGALMIECPLLHDDVSWQHNSRAATGNGRLRLSLNSLGSGQVTTLSICQYAVVGWTDF